MQLLWEQMHLHSLACWSVSDSNDAERALQGDPPTQAEKTTMLMLALAPPASSERSATTNVPNSHLAEFERVSSWNTFVLLGTLSSKKKQDQPSVLRVPVLFNTTHFCTHFQTSIDLLRGCARGRPNYMFTNLHLQKFGEIIFWLLCRCVGG